MVYNTKKANVKVWPVYVLIFCAPRIKSRGSDNRRPCLPIWVVLDTYNNNNGNSRSVTCGSSPRDKKPNPSSQSTGSTWSTDEIDSDSITHHDNDNRSMHRTRGVYVATVTRQARCPSCIRRYRQGISNTRPYRDTSRQASLTNVTNRSLCIYESAYSPSRVVTWGMFVRHAKRTTLQPQLQTKGS